MEIVVTRTKFVAARSTLAFVGNRWSGHVTTTHGAVWVYVLNGWAYLRLTIDGHEYSARVVAPGPPREDPLCRLAIRFARTVAKLAAGSPDGKGPITMTLAR